MAEIKSGSGLKYKPLVPPEQTMKEFTVRALILGLIMSVVLGAANAYLGLKAGMTIAATYPAAVISMAFLRLFRGTILEENFARTVGSIGESVAAGAIFTIPAFLIAGVWQNFDSPQRYWESSFIMVIGGVIGILFVTLLRRVLVEDPELPFPESVAASEIHKAGQAGGSGAKYLFGAMGIGALIQTLGKFNFFATSWEKFTTFAKTGVKLLSGRGQEITSVSAGGGTLLTAPAVSPAYIGVGFIIGPRLAALNFSGGLLAWGLFVPLLMYFLGPQLEPLITQEGQPTSWVELAYAIWKFIVRPIAIGGMLLSAIYTLYRMRSSLAVGLKRSISDLKKATAGETASVSRVDQDLSLKWVLPLLLIFAVLTFALYYYFSGMFNASITATIVMIIAGFFFAAVSGYLVGIIGSSNNPVSGLTLSTLIVAALLMVVLGVKGLPGVAAVLGVAAVICVAAAVAGEMFQDLKVGHILGGTPWKMQVGDIIGVIVASFVLYFPLLVLHQGDIKAGGTGFGGKALPAPQASLMAMLSKGIVGGEMAWPLIIVGMLMAFGLILLQVRSPMLVCVGMYLPFETTSAIFVGGLIRGITDLIAKKRKFTDEQMSKLENNGTLLASGLIAGEALMGLIFAGLAFYEVKIKPITPTPSYLISLVVIVLIALLLILTPIRYASQTEEKKS
ncbi:putative oligopeptide transporter, OPT family [Candidatus Kryptonium thompsonii]|uniref:Putative oligopeptide transporter, OPT family n=3 Tax=Candidatus Kryptonium thompsonii TaxID=1633631 RepID=A0A0P1LQP3_9BACT|nr:oligopeptide transporter, OPT family [Candidatus Kryptonium thompsoni]CUS83022.1 putative oligopeptide transporter, OPT family [Candidatus Kryptonium thompsoni]CUS84345.1 putative oligopeptide transporter, OPT family [Candidatus Kryptonium thompsoni]CUS86370.1 putative oligopeptide transporter, OPT family [Candidatus Kryptonium thompsoni]CUS89548.1 putative oligopeptide transporter, OPT family [Candidatus Kryptonium thompsoni]CUT03249.1 putative oligopeptide transporter, OPT family [Candida